MKTLPYTPLTDWQVAVFRSYLPHIVEWLRAREAATRRATAKLIEEARP